MALSRLVAAVAVRIRLLFIIIIASAAAGHDLCRGVAPFRSGRGGLTCQYKPRRDRTTVFHLLRCFFFYFFFSPSATVVPSSCYLFFFYLYSVFCRLFAHSPPNPPATNGRRVHRSPSRAADLSAKTRRPRTRVVFTAVRRFRRRRRQETKTNM